MTHDIIEDERNIAEANAVWDSGIEFSPNSNTYKLVRALLSEGDRIDGDLEDIYDAQHINSATGEDLEKWGSLVNVSRKTGESDDKYRARIKGVFRASTIGTTYDQFTEFSASVLSTNINNLRFDTDFSNDPATIIVSADAGVYNAVNLSASELNDILERGVPAGHAVRIREGGTFRLKADGDGDDPAKGLTADGISTGGTLAEDLV